MDKDVKRKLVRAMRDLIKFFKCKCDRMTVEDMEVLVKSLNEIINIQRKYGNN